MTPTRTCFPVTTNFVANAIKMHGQYVRLLDDWEAWLGTGTRPSNAEQLLLWQLIDLTLKRRDKTKDGSWADVNAKVLPTVEEMNNVLNNDRFDRFGNEMRDKRQQIEDTAFELVNLLQAPDFLTELNSYPYPQRWEYIGQLADRLGDSAVGLLYLRQGAIAQTPADLKLLPLLHPLQLTSAPRSLSWKTASEDVGLTRKAFRAYVFVFEKLMPAFAGKLNPGVFEEVFIDLIIRSVNDPRIEQAAAGERLTVINDLIMKDVDAWVKVNRPWWWEKPAVVKLGFALQGVLDVANVVFASQKLSKDPKNPALYLALSRAVSSLAGSAAKVGESFDWQFLKRSKAAKDALTRYNAVYDIVIGAVALYDTEQAVRTGDLSVALGQGMQAAGLFAGAYVGLVTIGVTGAIAPPLALLAIAGLLLVLAGSAIVTFTQDTPYEQWLQNSWFGDNWGLADVDANPGTPMWRTKVKDPVTGQEYPDIARQVSFWVSMFYPIDFKVTGDATFVYVTCKPKLAAPDALVNLSRIENEAVPVFTDFHSFPVYSKPLNDTSDLNIAATLEGTPPNQHVAQWTARLDHGSWWPTIDTSRHWFEVEMTPAGALSAALAEDVKNSDGLPFLLRASTKVEFP